MKNAKNLGYVEVSHWLERDDQDAHNTKEERLANNEA